MLALIHRETGKVASAKNPRAWRALLQLAATGDCAVMVTFPDGTVMASTDPGIDAALSRFLGQPVTLTAVPPAGAVLDRADPEQVLRDGIRTRVRVETGQLGGASPAGTFFDFAPLHLLTTSTLDRIAVQPARNLPSRSATGPTSSSRRQIRDSPRTTGSGVTCASAATSPSG